MDDDGHSRHLPGCLQRQEPEWKRDLILSEKVILKRGGGAKSFKLDLYKVTLLESIDMQASNIED